MQTVSQVRWRRKQADDTRHFFGDLKHRKLAARCELVHLKPRVLTGVGLLERQEARVIGLRIEMEHRDRRRHCSECLQRTPMAYIRALDLARGARPHGEVE